MLLCLKMEEEAMSQGIQAASRNSGENGFFFSTFRKSAALHILICRVLNNLTGLFGETVVSNCWVKMRKLGLWGITSPAQGHSYKHLCDHYFELFLRYISPPAQWWPPASLLSRTFPAHMVCQSWTFRGHQRSCRSSSPFSFSLLSFLHSCSLFHLL